MSFLSSMNTIEYILKVNRVKEKTCFVRTKKKTRHFYYFVFYREKKLKKANEDSVFIFGWTIPFLLLKLNKCEVRAHNNNQQRSRLLSGPEIMKRVIMRALYLVKKHQVRLGSVKAHQKVYRKFSLITKKKRNRWKARLNHLKEAHWLHGGGKWEECSRAVTILFSYYYVSINCLSSRQCTIERSVLIMHAYRSLKLNIAYKQL